MKSRSLFGFDISLLLATLILMAIGVLFIYSSGVTSSGISLSNEYVKQIIWVAVGLIILFSFVLTNYYRIGEYSLYVYLIFLGLLVFTLFFGKVVNGARSWIPIFGFGFQSSEFAKVATILYLARFLERNNNGSNDLLINATGAASMLHIAAENELRESISGDHIVYDGTNTETTANDNAAGIIHGHIFDKEAFANSSEIVDAIWFYS